MPADVAACVHRWWITGKPPVYIGTCCKCHSARTFTPTPLHRGNNRAVPPKDTGADG